MENKTNLSGKLIIKILAVVAIVLAFCPAFLVSCSGQEVEVTVLKVATGYGSEYGYGEYFLDPQPAVYVCLILPIVIIAISFLGTLKETTAAIVTMVLAGIDLIAWLLFEQGVKEFAANNYCQAESTPMYYLTLVSLIGIIVFSALEYTKSRKPQEASTQKVDNMEGPLSKTSDTINSGVASASSMIQSKLSTIQSKLSAIQPKQATDQIKQPTVQPQQPTAQPQQPTAQPKQPTIQPKQPTIQPKQPTMNAGSVPKASFCGKCGAKISPNCKFCPACGTPVSKTNNPTA